ncbi:hypothetical protein [Lysinibacillus sp. K60]|uniref:hypothetical protein n=1 Tax=Lysinibacillus sp. K60 TaxID=2720027 RepID=UPI001C8B855A|nr:hypothetical protein [Lysinibacillus sp. K60]MBX8945860.1 hypothetical protein [Lysinibacillus sp. K60]
MKNFEIGFILVAVVFVLGLFGYLFFSPDPLRFFSDYPLIDSISVDKIKHFEIGDDKALIEKEIGEGYETSSLNEEGIRSSKVVYKRIENNQVRLIKFHYTDGKLSSLVIN